MSKDFNTLVQEGVASKEMALAAFLDSQFYPRLVADHTKKIQEAFALYWNGELEFNSEEMRRRCWFVSGPGRFEQMFGQFRVENLEPEE